MSNMSAKNELLKTLELAFAGYTNKRTKRLYQRLVCKLLRFHNPGGRLVLPPSEMTQYHVDEFLAWMVRPGEYSRSYCNTAKRAIDVFFKYIDNPVDVKMVSIRHKQTIPSTITRPEVQGVVACLEGVYRLAAQDFYSLGKPKEILSKYANGRGAMRRQTLNQKIKVASTRVGITKNVTSSTLRNSGIAHLLAAGVPVTEVAEKAGVTAGTIKTFWQRLNNIR